jgi:hypothetical protein
VTAINRAKNSASTAVCAIPNSHHRQFNYRTRTFLPSRHHSHRDRHPKNIKKKGQKQSTAGIRWWSPTQLLTGRHMA